MMKDPEDMTFQELREEVFRLRAILHMRGAMDDETALSVRYGFTKMEASVVAMLWRARGRVVERWFMWDTLWDTADPPQVKILDIFICKARKKMGGALNDRIETVWGRGYRLTSLALAEMDALNIQPMPEAA